MSLRLRIFLLFLILILVALSFTLVTVNTNVREAGKQRVFESLSVGHRVFKDKIASELNNFEKAAKILGKEDGLREALFDDELSLQIALANFLNRLRLDHEADLLWLLDLDGGISGQAGVLTNDNAFRYSSILLDLENQGWSERTIVPLDGRLYELAIVGVFIPLSAPSPNFWMVIGRQLNDAFASEMADLTQLEILIMGETVETSWAKSTNRGLSNDVFDAVVSQPSGHGFAVDFYDEEMLGLKVLLDSEPSQPVYALLLKSEQEVQKQLRDLTGRLFVIGIIALLVSVVGAALLSRSVTKPLQQLVAIAQRIGRGDYSTNFPNDVSGEVGTLSQAFHTMRTDIAKREEEIEFIAYHDTLTKLPNRNAFIEELQHAIADAEKTRTSFSVCILDFDRFQEINDTLGHHNGDRVLLAFSARLSRLCRKRLKISRLGGDEFAVLILDQHDTATEVENIQALVLEPIEIERIALEIHLSMGVSIYPDHGQTPNTLLQTAEVAMYLAKQEKRNVVYYEKQRDQYSTQRLTLIAELRSAIESNQLTLYYQPKLDIEKDKFTHVECLVRWIHPRFGFISPEEFISYAEQTGTIRDLTQWVVMTALDQCKSWKNEGKNIKVAINISAIDLTQEGFSSWVMNMLSERGLSPADIVLEVTESAVMNDIDLALTALTELKRMGVSLSIDDYGTGYSSMAQLKCMPVDELKIDKSFVLNLDEKNDDYIIVKSTIELGHNMGLKIVAEGVESKSALDMLAELDCDLAQGYFLSRPLAPDKIGEWLDENADKIEQHIG